MCVRITFHSFNFPCTWSPQSSKVASVVVLKVKLVGWFRIAYKHVSHVRIAYRHVSHCYAFYFQILL